MHRPDSAQSQASQVITSINNNNNDSLIKINDVNLERELFNKRKINQKQRRNGQNDNDNGDKHYKYVEEIDS